MGFLNPMSQLRRTDVTTFCMQLRNHLEREQLWGERGAYLGIRDGEGRWKNHHFSGVHSIEEHSKGYSSVTKNYLKANNSAS